MILIEQQHDKMNKMTSAPSEDSDQSLRYPHEEAWRSKLPNKCTAKALIRLGGCPG